MLESKIQVHIHGGEQIGQVHVCGTMYDNQVKHDLSVVASRLSVLRGKELRQFLDRANGFFSIVSNDGKSGWMAVDRIRSFPLFYGLHKGCLFISNEARWIKQQVDDYKPDSLSCDEFLLTGFVTGKDTLFSAVKQVRPGEVVFFSTDEACNVNIGSMFYSNYHSSSPLEDSQEELSQKLDGVLVDVFRRLVSYANGRTIIVPLSGGYDSRLIVLMLKKLRYDNIITFSYGKPRNQESIISKFVAGELGVRWKFVAYSEALWHQWYRSQEIRAYFDYADGLTSLPHIQDWPAVWLLKKKGEIPNNTIFVPGISADLNTGGFIKKYPDIYKQTASKQHLLELILDYSYNLFPFDSIPKISQLMIRQKVIDIITGEPYSGSIGENFECWVSLEKVAKFIVNSVRAYEFFGFSWWLPFWDKDFVDFWYNVPHSFRQNQELYKTCITKITRELDVFRNIDPLFRDGNLRVHSRLEFRANKDLMQLAGRRILIPIAKTILPNTLKSLLYSTIQIRKAFNHPLAWYGVHEKERIVEQIRNGASNINSILVDDYISMMCMHRDRENV